MNYYRTEPIEVHELADSGIIEAAFAFFDDWLQELDMTVEDASIFFSIDYASAKCRYTDLVIPTIGKKVATANAKKYEKLISIYNADYDPLCNYDRTEESTTIRTPNLTTGTSSSGTAGTTTSDTQNTTNNQTHTQTTTPNQYKVTTEKQTAPFDTQTYKNSEKETSEQTGSNVITDTYSGQPDTVSSSGSSSTTSSGSSTVTETGTDTTGLQSHVVGNVGVTTSQQMAEAEISLAEKMAIWKVIESDLAAELLLQVW